MIRGLKTRFQYGKRNGGIAIEMFLVRVGTIANSLRKREDDMRLIGWQVWNWEVEKYDWYSKAYNCRFAKRLCKIAVGIRVKNNGSVSSSKILHGIINVFKDFNDPRLARQNTWIQSFS